MNTGMIRVLSENSDFLVCLKPVGVDSEHALPALLAPDHGGSIFPVHRLDQGVGGVMVFAKNRESAAEFSRLIRDGLLRKEYVACCHGCPPPEGEMRDLLFKDSRRNKVFVVKRQRAGVREAVLSYRVLASGEDKSLVRVRLETGRSHQIRVQFASRGFPLFGDRKYGARDDCPAPMLFSCLLSFPFGGKERSFESLPDWAESNAE
jgi:23S rRNA pseudouridine1911/1915/1917 synthase